MVSLAGMHLEPSLVTHLCFCDKHRNANSLSCMWARSWHCGKDGIIAHALSGGLQWFVPAHAQQFTSIASRVKLCLFAKASLSSASSNVACKATQLRDKHARPAPPKP